MPQISAFRGLRYDLGHVGSLKNVLTPHADDIDAEMQRELYKRHPANAIRLVKNRKEPGDVADARYRRAGQFFRNWQREGVLQREPNPAIYVYHQIFAHEGSTFTRRGFTCLTDLAANSAGNIFPSQDIDASANISTQLIRSCKANLNPVLSLYPDPTGETQALLESAIEGVAGIQAEDELGVTHCLWPVSDIRTIVDLASLMNPKPATVVQGNGTFAAAKAYQAELSATGTIANHGANFLMMNFSSMDDEGIISLPTHRVFNGPATMKPETLKQRLSDSFDVQICGEGPEYAATVWDQIEIEDDPSMVGLFCGTDQRWLIAKLNQAGRDRFATIAPDQSSNWRATGSAIADRLIMGEVLGVTSTSPARKSQCIDALVSMLSDSQTKDNDLAILTLPPTVKQIQELAQQGEFLPNDSLNFFPHQPCGLVFNSHEA